jgi:type II secretory pathway pseudopilin PulG
MNFSFFTKQIRAFSLVEILVVLGLFSSIATLSLGALFNTQSINGHLQETQAILDNVNLSVQTMTRDIRFGSEFYATTTLPTSTTTIPTVRKNCEYGIGASAGCTVLVFRSADATSDLDRTVFYVRDGILYKEEYPSGGEITTLQMTGNDVVISSLMFYVEGAQTSDGSNDDGAAIDYKQAIVTVLISGRTVSTKTSVPSIPFSVQTHVSAREPDNK